VVGFGKWVVEGSREDGRALGWDTGRGWDTEILALASCPPIPNNLWHLTTGGLGAKEVAT
jgi:hypothetical protein